MTPLGTIVHMLARRSPTDDGFLVSTHCMSTTELEYFTRERVDAGELLYLKIVNGPHVLDIQGVVQTVSCNNLDPNGPPARMSLNLVNDHNRRVLQSLIERHRASIA